MAEEGSGPGGSLINIGDLAQPATELIRQVSNALAGVARPWQIGRVAKAESKAELIRAHTQIQITEIQERGLARLVHEEGQKQRNIENILKKALPLLEESAKPEEIDQDWYVHFFDRNRLISNDEMQNFWARMLAKQANAPGSFSKRSIDIISNFEKSDFELFTSICRTMWFFPGYGPVIFDHRDKIFNEIGITFPDLAHLEALGLAKLDATSPFHRYPYSKCSTLQYFDRKIMVEFRGEAYNQLNVGCVVFTKAGEELAPICGAEASDDFFDRVINWWLDAGLVLYSQVDPSVTAQSI